MPPEQATERPNENPFELEVISSEYQETIIGPEIDQHVDHVAAKYIIRNNDRNALDHLTDRIRGREPELVEDLSAEELAGRVEWWVRENYQHLSR